MIEHLFKPAFTNSSGNLTPLSLWEEGYRYTEKTQGNRRRFLPAATDQPWARLNPELQEVVE